MRSNLDSSAMSQPSASPIITDLRTTSSLSVGSVPCVCTRVGARACVGMRARAGAVVRARACERLRGRGRTRADVVPARAAARFGRGGWRATGARTGWPMHTGQMRVLGGAPYSLAQEQNALVAADSCTCVSMPITASYVTASPPATAAPCSTRACACAHACMHGQGRAVLAHAGASWPRARAAPACS